MPSKHGVSKRETLGMKISHSQCSRPRIVENTTFLTPSVDNTIRELTDERENKCRLSKAFTLRNEVNFVVTIFITLMKAIYFKCHYKHVASVIYVRYFIIVSLFDVL